MGVAYKLNKGSFTIRVSLHVACLTSLQHGCNMVITWLQHGYEMVIT